MSHPEWEQPTETGYRVSSSLINEPPTARPRFKILMIGAGASGIDFRHYAVRDLADLSVELVCYEKNADIGGAWVENRYPGCACDIPSVGYTFPWKANPKWTSYYSSSQDIWKYMKQIVDEEQMGKYITFNTAVVGAQWDENRTVWVVKLGERIR